MAHCSSCGAEIRWITLEDSGKKMPIDVAPDDANGTVVLTAGDKGKVCTRAELVHYAFGGRRFYKPHFPRRCTDRNVFEGRCLVPRSDYDARREEQGLEYNPCGNSLPCRIHRAPASERRPTTGQKIALARYPKTRARVHLEQVMKELGKK